MIEINPDDMLTLDKSYARLQPKNTEASTYISKQELNNILSVLASPSFMSFVEKVKDKDYLDNITYDELMKLVDLFGLMKDELEAISVRIDISEFVKSGYRLDIAGLQDVYDQCNLNSVFPNINWSRLQELYSKPPRYIDVKYNKKDRILVDSFVFRKFMQGMLQMIFNKMDLVSGYIGKEGGGKSTLADQHMHITHYILTEIGIIDYKLNIDECFHNNLASFRECEDRHFKDPFWILGLDEGNELNKQDWREPEVQTFFQRLRRERHNQRIKFICIPVLSELLTNVVLTRMNFLFEVYMRNRPKMGILEKGNGRMYIFPRGELVYSPEQRRNISESEVRHEFRELVRNKKDETGIPKSLIIKKFKFNGVMGFDPEVYIKKLKDTNETFTIGAEFSMTKTEAFYLYKAGFKLKNLGVKNTDPKYKVLAGLRLKLIKYFEKNPNMLQKLELQYSRREVET